MKRLAFNGGEITPAMALRSDMDVYPRSCTRLENFDVHATGGISRRHGFAPVCDALQEPSTLIPFTYSDKHVYLIELAASTLRVFDTASDTIIATFTGGDTWQYGNPHQVTWQQINSLLLICSADCPLMQLKLAEDLTWTFTPFQFKCPPWQTLDIRNHKITVTPTQTQHAYSITFATQESPVETDPDPDDILRASYYTQRQETAAPSKQLRSGTWHTFNHTSPGITAESTFNINDKIAIATAPQIAHYICVKDFEGSRDFTPGCTSPENYMAAEDPRFMAAEDLTGFDAITPIYTLSSGSNYKKGDKLSVYSGYWQLYTCITPFTPADYIPGCTTPADYPAYFTSGIPTSENALTCRGTWKFHCSGTWYGNYEIRRSYDSPLLTALWETLGESISPLGSPANNILTGDEIEEECYLRLFLTRIRYMGSNIASGWPADTCGNALIVTSYKHDMVLRLHADGTYIDESPIRLPLSSPLTTDDWSWHAFTARYGYPTLATVHESRLVLAATATQPQTIWASVTDDLNNFLTGKQDTSALHLTMSTTTQANICWLLSRGEVIMLGTEDAEWVISSTSGQGLTPTTARIINHGRVGSAHIPAVQAIDRVLYCERGSSRLYQYGFDWNTNSYTSTDLTIFADHIAADAGGITSGTMQRKPYPRAIFTLADGTLALMTYNTHHQVNAWHRYTTQGHIETACALPNGTAADKLYLITTRFGTRKIECCTPTAPYIDSENLDYTSTVSTTALWPPETDERKTPTSPLDAYITTTTPAANITVRTAETAPYATINHTGNLTPGWHHLIAAATWSNRPHLSIRCTGNTPFTILALQI